MVIGSERIEPKEAKDKFVSESNKYLRVKNHVREMYDHSEAINGELGETKDCIKKCKKRQKSEKQSVNDDSMTVNDSDIISEIPESDLRELKKVYNKCKAVLLKIESKYGHLLDLDKDDCTTSKKRKHENTEQHECKCLLKSKVVFNDDGNIVQSVDSSLDHHICTNRLKTPIRYQPVQIEVENVNISLPDNIKELEEMLQDSSLSTIFRDKIVEKIKYKRHEYINMIRFEKHSIIEKIKSNPEEILDFKGTNLSCILGYSNKSV